MFVLITLFAPESGICSAPCVPGDPPWSPVISQLLALWLPGYRLGLAPKCGSGPGQPEATAGAPRVKKKHT